MKFKKFLSLFVTVALLSSFAGTAFAQYEADTIDSTKNFSDVDDSHKNSDAINYLHDEEIVEGYKDGEYKADKYIDRAEFIKIVVETQGYNVEGKANCFNDVEEQWFAKYVCGAADLGIVDGYSDNYFRPGQDINFAEASKIIVEAFLLSVDGSNQDSWFHNYIVALELLKAIPLTIDSFDKYVTRGEIAEMIWRIDTDNKTEDSHSYSEVKVLDGEKLRTITVSDKGDGRVAWTTDGVSDKGFKVTWSMNEDPVYPARNADRAQFREAHEDSSHELEAFAGEGSYYVRVCNYTGSGCDVYSNQITIYLYLDEEKDTTKDTTDVSDVSSITLSDDGDGRVKWSVDGTSDQGFKVVWSKTSGAEYPLRTDVKDKYIYLSDSSADSTELTAFDGAGTYYARVCEYLSGKCGIYSNEITVEL